jgi:hypothetical protein
VKFVSVKRIRGPDLITGATHEALDTMELALKENPEESFDPTP